jgi:hypothetical protein
MTALRKRPTKRAQKVRPVRHRRFAALARRLTPRNVKVVFHNNGNFGCATIVKSRPEIYVPRLTSTDHLATYFHELGHILNWRHRSESESESEYEAEAYSVRMMRITGIPLPPRQKRGGTAYVGWFVVNDLLHNRKVSAQGRAFVGLKGLDDTTIIIAHILTVQRIRYSPKPTRAKKSEWQGRLTDHDFVAPADRKYWSALLASVSKARMQRNQPGFDLIRIDPNKPRGPENIAWSRWPECGPRIHPMATEAEVEQAMIMMEKRWKAATGTTDDHDYYGE